jgi:hypothetical protein
MGFQNFIIRLLTIIKVIITIRAPKHNNKVLLTKLDAAIIEEYSVLFIILIVRTRALGPGHVERITSLQVSLLQLAQ